MEYLGPVAARGVKHHRRQLPVLQPRDDGLERRVGDGDQDQLLIRELQIAEGDRSAAKASCELATRVRGTTHDLLETRPESHRPMRQAGSDATRADNREAEWRRQQGCKRHYATIALRWGGGKSSRTWRVKLAGENYGFRSAGWRSAANR